ncbi:uncharacterized protein LOC113510988 isoform X2 [Galleria mellonella]|uniref:Uncharacterized protein LOC113510988 isoform X2 n=1 Tax=Galleria mellonella TaxID=7137 RepID=A0ABM3MUB3_GALME|nr:uncharacterized protein LOC113510988 isoform X2 [Galleria mellonella]
MESFTTECGKYRIESLSGATFSGALEVIRVAFCQDESVCIGCEVNENPVAIEELLELCADAALDAVSLVAVEIETGEVVAVAFNKIQVAATDTSERAFFETFAKERCTQGPSRSLVEFMADVDARCNLFEKYAVDCSLEIMFLATKREHRRRKLAQLLCKVALDLAKKLKDGPVSKITLEELGSKYSMLKPRSPTTKYPKICQAIWTSEGTQRIGKNLNFIVHLTVPFKEFMYEGKSYAERIGSVPSFCEVVAKPLY